MNRILAIFGIALGMPFLLFAWVGVQLSGSGPFLYRASRAGFQGKPFTMYKVRTMRVPNKSESYTAVTADRDPRVFWFGGLIRKLKIDEIPQLFNVVRGDMALVGPRPEDLDIVRDCYEGWHLETLDVLPGIVSPGALFNYTHFSTYVRDAHVYEDYRERFLPRKLALDVVYVRCRSWFYDFKIVLRTAATIVMIAMGRKSFPLPPEAKLAEDWFGIDFSGVSH